MTLFLTPRLRVRPFTPADEATLHALLCDPAVMEHLEPPFTPAQTRAFLYGTALRTPPPVYAAELRGCGSFAGYLILHPLPGQPEWELGWVLRPALWGQGLAAELTAAAVAYARQQGVPALVLECVPAQAATRQIAAKFGFGYANTQDGLLQYRLPLNAPG